MVRSTDRPAMTIAVDLGRKATKQTNKHHWKHLITKMDFTAIKYSGQGCFKVKKGTIDKLLFLLKTIGIYP